MFATGGCHLQYNDHRKQQEREIEKTKLLDFSNAIASIHDKKGFLKLINTKLKDLFSFSAWHDRMSSMMIKKLYHLNSFRPQGENSAEWDYEHNCYQQHTFKQQRV